MKVEVITPLKRQVTKILATLRNTKEPVLMTEYGKPSAYLVDVEDYDYMQKRLAILEGIAEGERAIFENETINHDKAKESMEK